MAKKSDKIVFLGTGRRKKSIARVRLVEGKGSITVNGKPLDEYFGTEVLKVIVKQPLVATNTLDKYDVICKVQGGGFTGQAGAGREQGRAAHSGRDRHPEEIQRGLRTDSGSGTPPGGPDCFLLPPMISYA